MIGTIAKGTAIVATPWLVLAAANAGGWIRFFVAVLIAVVFGSYLRRELW